MFVRNLRKSKVLTAFMFICVMVVATFLPSSKALASETKPSLNSTKGTVFMYTDDTLTVEHIPSGLQKISWDSSSESVLTVKSNSKTGVTCTLTPKKAGTSKVTCTVVSLDKTYTLTCDITVKKASPFKKIYINGKNKYKSKKSTISYDTESFDKVKVTTKLRSGWTLVSKEYEVYNTATQIKSSGDVPSTNKVPVGRYQTKVYLTAMNDSNEFFTYTVIINKKTSATAKPKFTAKSGTVYQKTINNTLTVKNFPSGATVVWSSGNTKVAKVKSSDIDGIAIITPKKTGSATITCIITKKDKTTTKLTYKVKVKSKAHPLSSVEIDGTNILSKTSNNYYKTNTTDHSVLVQSYEKGDWNIVEEVYTKYNTPTIYGNEIDIPGDGEVNIGTYKSVVKVTLKNSSNVYYTFTLEIYNTNYKK
ncbi:MAG: hypothetical protein ACERKZ_20535 [Lachnotalea sp.]